MNNARYVSLYLASASNYLWLCFVIVGGKSIIIKLYPMVLSLLEIKRRFRIGVSFGYCDVFSQRSTLNLHPSPHIEVPGYVGRFRLTIGH